jgi:hypothetical protein
MSRICEIRDPIHGFIDLDEWEMEIVNHPAFQRLRRIRQLGLSELIYPGTTHTRFEHSLGVLHVGTRMFDQIIKKREEFLRQDLHFSDGGFERDRRIVRLACLLHDVGHSPFSHAGEDIMPKKGDGKYYKHEDYSAGIIRHILKDVIESHSENENLGIKADDVADMVEGKSTLGRRMIWHDIVSSQLDADRSDYLLRDSYYAGVSYGHYDLNRIIATLTIALDDSGPTLAIDASGKHAAEALIIARYMMFWQVYFQKTRRICDFHATEAVKELLKGYKDNVFLPPTSEENLKDYIAWDDYKVFGAMHNKECGRHSRCLFDRRHDRCVHETSEPPSIKDLEFFEKVQKKIASKVSFVDNASSTWYKLDDNEIPIYKDDKIVKLSSISQIIPALQKSGSRRIYVPLEFRNEVKGIISTMRKIPQKGNIE